MWTTPVDNSVEIVENREFSTVIRISAPAAPVYNPVHNPLYGPGYPQPAADYVTVAQWRIPEQNGA